MAIHSEDGGGRASKWPKKSRFHNRKYALPVSDEKKTKPTSFSNQSMWKDNGQRFLLRLPHPKWKKVIKKENSLSRFGEKNLRTRSRPSSHLWQWRPPCRKKGLENNTNYHKQGKTGWDGKNSTEKWKTADPYRCDCFHPK